MATLAPVVMSLALWAITQSPYALKFAALGPGVALASRLDARRASRKLLSVERQRFEREIQATLAELDRAHAAERAHRGERAPSAAQLMAGPSHVRWGGVAHPRLRLGTCSGRSEVTVDASADANSGVDEATAGQLRQLHSAALVLSDSPLIVDVATGVGITGPTVLAAACARALVVQLLASSSPTTYRLEGGGAWLDAVPHARDAENESSFTVHGPAGPVTIMVASEPAAIPPTIGMIVVIDASGALLGTQRFTPELLSVAEAQAWVTAAAAVAVRNGLRRSASALPAVVSFGELVEKGTHPPDAGGLRCPIGRDETDVVRVDLVRDGPHAIVGGTTGSGKSELLVTWLLSMAAAHSPDEVNFLLFDFKGGSSFGTIPQLPHCVGIVTDLDDGGAARAVASLAAEIRHRERALAAQGVRTVDEATGIARLVIAVDEFAAMAAELPSLHDQLADVAARGRSLGMHLVLCTQRPAGVVRDAVLANASLRISLRVNNRADSMALLGSGEAAESQAAHAGRAWVATAEGTVRPVQVALVRPDEVVTVIERWPGAWAPRRPWLDPLPPVISSDDLPHAIGLIDLPDEQAQRPVAWHPNIDGNLIAIGAARTGKSNLLRVIARTLEQPVIGTGLEAAWDALMNPGAVVLLDDVDTLLAQCTPDYQQAFIDLLTSALRSPTTRLALTTQRITGPIQQLSALCDERVLLRMPNRQEHVIAGGSTASFDPNLPPGAGTWRGARVQLALASDPLPAQVHRAMQQIPSETLLAVSTRPRALAALLERSGRRLVALPLTGDCAAGSVILTDPDGWQANWAQAAMLVKEHAVIFHECSLTEFRQLSRQRRLPPPLADPSTTGWLLELEGEVRRVQL